jgi:periplasmic copper chaperone A
LARQSHRTAGTALVLLTALVLTELLLTLRAAAAPPSGTQAAPPIRVADAWIRWLPAGVPAAGYATLINIGDSPVICIGVASSYFRDVSIHRSVQRDGHVEMSPVDRLTLDAHAKVDLGAAGYHLMLMQPTRPIEAGDHVPITLRFADGSSLTVSFEVRKTGG